MNIRKGSLVKYDNDMVAQLLNLGTTFGVVSMIHHDDIVVVLTNGKTFIDSQEKFIVLSY